MHVNTDTNGNCVLLQTAIADVSKPNDPIVWAAVRLMFDSCSQKSYITNKLHSELCLPVIGKGDTFSQKIWRSHSKASYL